MHESCETLVGCAVGLTEQFKVDGTKDKVYAPFVAMVMDRLTDKFGKGGGRCQM